MVSVFTSGYVNKETILHFFYKITKERGTKNVFAYAHVKWFYGQSERVLFELFYNTKYGFSPRFPLSLYFSLFGVIQIKITFYKDIIVALEEFILKGS